MPSEEDRYLHSRFAAARAQLGHLPRAARLLWSASRRATLVWLALMLIQGLLPVALVLLAREVVDGAVAAVAMGGTWASLRPLVWPASLLAGVVVLDEVLGGLLGWVRAWQSRLIEDCIAAAIHERSAAVDLAFYETPEYYDHLHRARAEAWHRPRRLVDNAGAVLQGAVTLLAMGGLLFSFGAVVPLVLVLSTLPALLVVLRHAERQHRWRLANTEDERRAWYCDWALTSAEAAAELRQFGLAGHYRRRFGEVRARLRRESLGLEAREGLAGLGAGLIALGAAGACLAWVAWRAVRGEVGPGDLVLFFAAFRQGQKMLRGLLTNVGDIYRNLLFLGDLFRFLDLEPGVRDPERPREAPTGAPGRLELRGVRFAYPGSSRPVLEGFDLVIPAGRTVAILGSNGSGKSTLLKLLCRLYDPDAGAVTLDGADLRELAVRDLRRVVTVLFQQPVRYSETARRNIAFGEVDGAPGDAEIERAAREARADEAISRLPRGYETVLGKWFEGGAELSVGEWQRLALARAFLRDARVILLDEPTSAMDSWAEADWMERFAQLAGGRTAVVITHRLTTARRADLICVMEDGRVIERGTHDELLALNGRYADSWARQVGPARPVSTPRIRSHPPAPPVGEKGAGG
jgi:ATP-binding cassette subfamily B protein